MTVFLLVAGYSSNAKRGKAYRGIVCKNWNNCGSTGARLSRLFEEGLHHLKSFKIREGHCRVPVAHIEGDYALGRWVNRQRTGKDRMSPKHRRQLDAIGFVWKVR